MGTVWSIQVVVGSQRSNRQAEEAIESALAEVERIEAMMSEFDPDSAVSRLNASAGGEPVAVPPELLGLVTRSLEHGARSQGAFDITWRALAPLWQLEEPDFAPPSAESVAEALARVDYRQVIVRQDRIGLLRAGMAIGLGGVAKGYAIDRAAAILEAAGIDRYLVDGGGDLRVGGDRGDGPWRVGIRHPRGGHGQALAVLEPAGGAVVTSGDYERFREVDGVRYHHILDPRTGFPATASMAVTVVAPTAEAADALATAAFVLGPLAGRTLVEGEPDTEALWLDPQGNAVMTSGFGRLLAPPASVPIGTGDRRPVDPVRSHPR